MVERKRSVMKYIRTYETEEKFLTDKDSTSRGFRLKPTLYKYSEAGDHVHLEIDDPRKREGSTWIRLEFTETTEFSFKISNVTGDDSNTLNYTIDWGDGTIETNTATRGDDGLYTFTHSYAIGTYDLELYGTDRSYMFVGNPSEYTSYFSTPEAVKRVVLRDEVEVGNYTFFGCSKLTSVNLPSTLTSIGRHAFSGCTSLTSITIPEGVTKIGSGVFNECSSLTSINIPEGVTSIESFMFNNCRLLTSINIPEGVTSIGMNAFSICTSLTSINIPKGVTKIEDYTFSICTSLTSINIPKGVTKIGNSVFRECALTSINLPSTLTYIGSQAFEYCTSLTSINIPEGVTSIGRYALKNCSKLTSISSYNTAAPTLGSSVFTGMSTNGTLHIKPGATGYDAWLSKLPSGWTIVEDL